MSLYRVLFCFFTLLSVSAPNFAKANVSTFDQSATSAAVQITDSANQNLTTEKVNLNLANAKDLIKIKGLNAARVRAIIAYRKKHGSFKNSGELTHVKGFKKIKLAMLKTIQEQLTV